MARSATRENIGVPSRSKSAENISGHRLFQEFGVATIDELVKQLEAEGQGIDVLAISGVPHLVCGRPMANVFVQADAAMHVPGDLLAIYQYCQGCRMAVRVL